MRRRHAGLALLAALLVSGCMEGSGPLVSEDFEGVAAGSLPATLESSVGDWKVQQAAVAPSGHQVLGQTATRYANAYAVATADTPPDVVAKVRLQVASGVDEREAGLTVRFLGPRDNYVFNLDANEGGVRFTRVRDGVRDDLYKDRTTRFYPNQWYTLEVHADGPSFRGFVDGREVFQVRDGTHADGGVGLWTRADTTARFDDFVVRS